MRLYPSQFRIIFIVLWTIPIGQEALWCLWMCVVCIAYSNHWIYGIHRVFLHLISILNLKRNNKYFTNVEHTWKGIKKIQKLPINECPFWNEDQRVHWFVMNTKWYKNFNYTWISNCRLAILPVPFRFFYFDVRSHRIKCQLSEDIG